MKRTAPASTLALAILASACAAPAPPAGPRPVPAPPEAPAPEYTPVSAGFPDIPRVDAAPEIRVVEPAAGGARPRVDSTAIYGSVGTGGALLTIDGEPVPVAPNGAFLAYLPVPADGVWRLEATRAGARDTLSVAYRAGSSGPTAAAATRSFSPALALVVRGADTLATGSDAPHARPTQTGTYRWFFPAGTRLSAVEQRGGQYRLKLDSGTVAWIDTADASPASGSAPSPGGAVRAVPQPGWVDVRLPAAFAPFRIEADSLAWRVTVYGMTAGGIPAVADSLLRAVGAGPGGVFTLQFARRPWGYKAFYAADGTLVIRVRRPPSIDPTAPLRGRRIVIDPGHPPAGATGPTGLHESEANLAVALPLAELLRAAGAEVVLTRTTEAPVGLAERTALAVRADAELLVSVHNNAFGEGQNPFRSFHTTVYYFQPFSADLAASIDRELAAVTGLRDRGAQADNLALVRPTWMPSALSESLFMPIPEQENALRDAAYVHRLAEAHLRGIEAFFRSRAGR